MSSNSLVFDTHDIARSLHPYPSSTKRSRLRCHSNSLSLSLSLSLFLPLSPGPCCDRHAAAGHCSRERVGVSARAQRTGCFCAGFARRRRQRDGNLASAWPHTRRHSRAECLFCHRVCPPPHPPHACCLQLRAQPLPTTSNCSPQTTGVTNPFFL